MMNEEMFFEFEKYLNKYNMSITDVLENLIFALDRSELANNATFVFTQKNERTN